MHPKGFEPLVEIMLSSRIKSPMQQPALPRVQNVAFRKATQIKNNIFSNLFSRTNYLDDVSKYSLLELHQRPTV